MIRTLVIHEFLRTKGMLGVITGIATAFVALGTILNATRWPGIAQLGLAIGFAGLFGFLAVALVALAIDYWRSAYGRGGYLTQTLPVRGATIYAARLLYGFAVVVAGLLWMLLLSIPLVLVAASPSAPAGVSTASYVSDAIRAAASSLSPTVWLVSIVLLVLFTWGYLVQYYFAASVGSESRLAHLGPFGPILVWFLLYVACQVLLVAGIVLVPYGIGDLGDGIGVVSVRFLDILRQGGNSDVMPLGFLPVLVLVTIGLIWRTARSWDRHVTLR